MVYGIRLNIIYIYGYAMLTDRHEIPMLTDRHGYLC